MTKLINIICPVSAQKANENVIRIIAFYVLAIAVSALYFSSVILAALLAIDFSIRAFTNGKFSLLKQLSLQTAAVFKIRPKPIDAAPKKFAALLGFIFSLLIVITLQLDLKMASFIIAGLLIFCAALESIVAVCIGCYVYTFISKFSN